MSYSKNFGYGTAGSALQYPRSQLWRPKAGVDSKAGDWSHLEILSLNMPGVCFLSVGNSAGLSDTAPICGLSMWSFHMGSLNFLQHDSIFKRTRRKWHHLLWLILRGPVALLLSLSVGQIQEGTLISPLTREFGSKSPCEKSVGWVVMLQPLCDIWSASDGERMR